MRMNHMGAIVAIAGLSCSAQGAVNVFELSGSSEVTISTAAQSGGKTRVTINLLSTATANRAVFIETSANDALGTIELKNQSSMRRLIVRIRGAGGDLTKRPASIEEVLGGDGADNAGSIEINECRVVGPVGLIAGINNLVDLEIGGSTSDPMIIALDKATGPNALPPAMLNCSIGGDVLYISLPGDDGRIDGVTIEGTLGGAVVDQIGSLQVGHLDGSIGGHKSGFVERVHQIIVGDGGGSGVFDGQILIARLEPEGGVPGALIFEQGISEGSTVYFSKDFALGDGVIDMPAGTLAGRIIIGYEGAPNPIWTAPVDVGGVTIASNYSTTAAALGGGSAGRVPFATHTKDSTPEFKETFAFTGAAVTPEYEIRHYGPIQFGEFTAQNMPVRLERRPRCIGADWLEVTGEWQFDYEVSAEDNAVLLMAATVPANYRNGFEYRFTRQGAPFAVVCDIPSAPLVEAYPEESWFKVGSMCPWDITGDDNTNIDDLNALLSDWNTTGNNLAGDINGTGGCDIDDLNLLLTHWNETFCEGCVESTGPGGGNEENSMMGGFFAGGFAFNEGDLLVSELGYATVEDFCADLASMNAEEQGVMLIALEVAAEDSDQ